jgi:hypothetical protein
MARQDLLAGFRLPSGRNTYETNDAAVRAGQNNGELAEVLVQGYEDSPF